MPDQIYLVGFVPVIQIISKWIILTQIALDQDYIIDFYSLWIYLCISQGDMAQEVRVVIWQSEDCWFDPTFGRVEVSLSKTTNPQLLLTANRHWCENVCVNEA